MQHSPFHVLIVDENALRAAILEEGLRAEGVAKITVLSDMHNLLMQVAALNPDVIVIDLESPRRDMLEQMFVVSKAVARPVAMFVDQSDSKTIEAAIEAGVSAYVVDGLKKERVKAVVDMAVSRFNAYAKLQSELQETRAELKDRKEIDRAKGLLMRLKNLSEDEAYRLMRTKAMNEKKKIADIARSLLLAAEFFDKGAGDDS